MVQKNMRYIKVNRRRALAKLGIIAEEQRGYKARRTVGLLGS